MNLLEMYENSKKEDKKFEEEKSNHEFKKELRRLISAIIQGEESFQTNNDKLIENLDIRVGKKNNKEKNCSNIVTIYSYSWGYGFNKYSFKLNKTNIQKVQNYIDSNKENKEI